MPVFQVNQKRVLFMHVPKAGGSTIEDLFKEWPMAFHSQVAPAGMKCTPQHLSYTDIRVLLGGIGWDYGFAVVRNPYDRAESEYRFRTEMNMKRYDKRPDFSLWLDRQLDLFEKNPFLFDHHFRAQVAFTGKDIEIFKLEDGMDQIVTRISEQVGVALDYDGKVINKAENYEELTWDPDLLHKFNKVYRPDFRQLGYEIREP
ncbi:MAG: hypothetical protein CMK07_03570 [Ponticaulis sp.]|nr:hypothetical protein [Ponticaulis sp.]